MGAIGDEDPGLDAALAVANSFAQGLLARLDSAPEWGRDEYLARCVTVGGPVVWESGSGVAVDVAADGALVVDTADGRISLASSQVSRIARGTVPPMRQHP